MSCVLGQVRMLNSLLDFNIDQSSEDQCGL